MISATPLPPQILEVVLGGGMSEVLFQQVKFPPCDRGPQYLGANERGPSLEEPIASNSKKSLRTDSTISNFILETKEDTEAPPILHSRYEWHLVLTAYLIYVSSGQM